MPKNPSNQPTISIDRLIIYGKLSVFPFSDIFYEVKIFYNIYNIFGRFIHFFPIIFVFKVSNKLYAFHINYIDGCYIRIL